MKDKNVYNKYNNAQYNFLKRNENFAHVVNYALGHDVCSPDGLRECDSREVVLVIEDALKGRMDGKDADYLVNLSKELFRDLKKLGVMKTDGRYIYLCVENQSTLKSDMRERINLYNALSYMNSSVGGLRIPVITVLAGWAESPYPGEMWVFDDFGIGEDSPLREFLPHYRIPVVNMAEISDEDLGKMNEDMILAVMALRIAKGKLDARGKKEALERMDGVRKRASEEAFKLSMCYTDIATDKEKVMENGFTTFWRETREEGRIEGRIEGRQEATLSNIRNLQNYQNVSFEKAAEMLGVSGEMLEKIRNA